MNTDCNCKSFSTVSEYPCKQKACIKPQKPDCLATAVIPAITVDTTEGITDLANCLVHVTTTNTTYYVDDKHRIMLVWAGPVEISGYDIAENPYNLRAQLCFTAVGGVLTEVWFDKQGVAHIMAREG